MVSTSLAWTLGTESSHASVALPVGTVVVRDLPSEPIPTGMSGHRVLQTHSPPPRAIAQGGARVAAVGPASLTVGPGFSGLDDSQCGCAPPDVIVAAGPTQVVEFVNLWMEVWTKQGAPVQSVSATSFFASGSDFLSDPRALYDNASGRWFASMFDAGPTGTGLVRFAVSSTSDASGAWTLYTTVTAPSGEFPDQPILGVSDLLVAFGGNMFSETTGAPFGSEYWVVDKASVLNGSSAAVQSWGPDPNYFSIHPVQSLGSTTTQYFASSTSASPISITLWAVTGVPPTSTVAMANVSVGAYAIAPSGQEPGGGQIDSADTRVQTAVWQSGNLWMAFDSQCSPNNYSGPRACIRVVEIDTTSATALQDFDYGFVGLDLYYPAIALDHAGDMTMVFGYSSSTVDPSGGVTGQASTDTPGTLQAYRTVIAGTSSQNCGGPCRYGDYFGAGADPTSPVIWVAAQYLTPTHLWNSWIAPVRTTGPASSVLATVPDGADVGSPVTITVSALNVTCSSLFGLYCSASVPLGDGTTVSSVCSPSASALSWSHTYSSVGSYPVGLGGYFGVYTTSSCVPASQVRNLTLVPFSLTVVAAPQVQLFASPHNGADVGQAIALAAVATGGRAPYSYQWIGLPAGCIDSGTAWVNCSAVRAATTSLTVVLTDANGVARSQSLLFTVADALVTSMVATRSFVDVGQAFALVATPSGGSGSYAFDWWGLPAGCFSQNLSGLSCTPTASGPASVYETTTDTNGVVVASAPLAIDVRPLLSVSLPTPSTGQTGQASLLVATAAGGSAPYSYSWTGLPGGCSSSDRPVLSCTPTGSGSYSIVVHVLDDAGVSVNATITWEVRGNGGGLAGVDLTTLLVIVGITVIAVALVAALLVRRRPRSPAPSTR